MMIIVTDDGGGCDDNTLSDKISACQININLILKHIFL